MKVSFAQKPQDVQCQSDPAQDLVQTSLCADSCPLFLARAAELRWYPDSPTLSSPPPSLHPSEETHWSVFLEEVVAETVWAEQRPA